MKRAAWFLLVPLGFAGAVFAKELLDTLLRHTQGTFSIKSHLTEKLIVYQLIGLAGIVGGAVAGSSSRNGFKQGLCAGILASALYFGVQLANPKAVLEITLFATFGVLVTSTLGGLFGSTLFPPLAKDQGKKAIPY